jgi:lipopolysaccharide/colanic/teichoic acid biosynthesis glycosyltransferase
MDTLFGLLGMLILGLIFPFLALLIRLDSPGPIFYSQERVGHQGRKFHIRKFRSMYHNAEQPGKAVWATEFDTRITRVGYFLRSTHLDELPQAFNMTSTTLNISHSRWIF